MSNIAFLNVLKELLHDALDLIYNDSCINAKRH